jgi:hypothetical protein
VVDLYMIGLGATANPSDFITNQEFSGAFPVSAPVTATVNGESAPVIFAGLTSPGLYLVRISIPSDLQPGSSAIQVSIGNPSAGGAQTSALLTLAIGTTPVNLIQNGNFGSALAGTWSLTVNSAQGAAASAQTTAATSATSGGSSAQITVTSTASDPANYAAVQFSQTGLTLDQGQVYRLMFWAKADSVRTQQLDVTNAAGASVFSSSVALTRTWQQYVVYFQATAAVTAAQVDFDFGDQTGNAWLDGVVLQGSTP